MNIKLKETKDQVELIRAMGSKDPAVYRPAQETFAALLGNVVQKVLQQVGTASLLYKDIPFDENSDASFPLDLYAGLGVDTVKVWSQTFAGGLASSHVAGMQELKFATYPLDSAVDVNKKYARQARLDVVSQAINRMAQELLVKQERNAWIVALKALAEASTNATSHVIAATTAGIFQLDDLNRLLTRARRISASWANGTTSDNGTAISDILVSPEVKEDIRSFAYQPMNTRAVPNTDESTAVPLPDSVREGIFRAAGAQELYGVGITELQELGVNQKYNILFDNFYTSTFDPTTTELIFAVDLSKGSLLRPVARNVDSGAQITAAPDDQYVARQDKMGFYTTMEEGRMCWDARALLGITV